MTAADKHHTARQFQEDGSWHVSTSPAIHPGGVERRMFQIHDPLTDVASDKAAVSTVELRTYTFAAAEDYRYLELAFIPDHTGAQSDVMAVAWTVNAPNVTQAASRLSLTETDADSVAEYMMRGETVIAGTTEAITRIDMTGIFGSGGTTLAEDLVIIRVW